MHVNLSGPINHTGYGIASFNILKSLSQLHNVTYHPIGQPMVDNQKDYEFVAHLFQNGEININSPYIKIWHQFDLANHYGRGKYFAFPFFELDTFNTLEKAHLSVPDTIFVTSKWAQDVIKNNGILTSTRVVPLGVNLNIFDYTKYTKDSSFKNKYIFLNIGKWEVRKGHDILYNIFTKAFPTEQDVELWILASEKTNNYSTPEELSRWKNMYSADPRIKLYSGVQSHADIATIIANSDCGLYISRAEGWNLELLETMAMNKPAIATNYSAHTEFCNTDNTYLVDINHIELAYDGKAFQRQGNWAKIDSQVIDQTITHMRYVYQNRINTNINGLNTAKQLSWNNSAQIISRCISE